MSQGCIYIPHFNHAVMRTVLLLSFMCYCVRYLCLTLVSVILLCAYLWYHLSCAPHHVCWITVCRCFWDGKMTFDVFLSGKLTSHTNKEITFNLYLKTKTHKLYLWCSWDFSGMSLTVCGGGVSNNVRNANRLLVFIWSGSGSYLLLILTT